LHEQQEFRPEGARTLLRPGWSDGGGCFPPGKAWTFPYWRML